MSLGLVSLASNAICYPVPSSLPTLLLISLLATWFTSLHFFTSLIDSIDFHGRKSRCNWLHPLPAYYSPAYFMPTYYEPLLLFTTNFHHILLKWAHHSSAIIGLDFMPLELFRIPITIEGNVNFDLHPPDRAVGHLLNCYYHKLSVFWTYQKWRGKSSSTIEYLINI